MRFQYGSRPETRLVEPFAVGISSSSERLLLGWQVEGPSASGKSSGWKNFRVDGLNDLDLDQASFTPDRSGYDPETIQLETVLFHI